MATEVHAERVVPSGGKIEISTPELIEGKRAPVVLTIEDAEPDEQHHVIDLLTTLPGHRLFQNAEEVDASLREERDAWERSCCHQVAMCIWMPIALAPRGRYGKR